MTWNPTLKEYPKMTKSQRISKHNYPKYAASKTQKKVCYYKWEFLRRNPAYQKDYKEFLELCKEHDWKSKWDHIRYESFEKNPERQLRAGYGIAFLENPKTNIPLEKFDKNPFWPWLEDRGLNRPIWPTPLNPNFPENEPVIRNDFGNKFEGKMPYSLTLTINLTFPKKEIMEQVEKLLDDSIEDKKGKGLVVPSNRKRFDLYDQYLEIWDLRKKGCTFSKIALKLFPKELSQKPEEADAKYERRIDQLRAQGLDEREAYSRADKEFKIGGNPIQRVIDRHKEADRLVMGGYKEIR